jgi:hypothetical protein
VSVGSWSVGASVVEHRPMGALSVRASESQSVSVRALV